jgi:hypothetical protein
MRSRLLRSLALAAPLILMILAYAAELPENARPSVSVHDSSRQPSVAQRISAKGLPGLAEVSPWLYRGGQPTAAGPDARKHGYQHRGGCAWRIA